MLGSLSVLFACFLWLSILPVLDAAMCGTCYGQIPNCPGGESCSLRSSVTSNRAALAAASTAAVTLANLLPIKFIRALSRTFLESLKTFLLKTTIGSGIDWTALNVVDVAQLPIKGLATRADAVMELQSRLCATSDNKESQKIIGLITSLSSMGNSGMSETRQKDSSLTGIYSYVWAHSSRLVRNYAVLNTASLDSLHLGEEKVDGSSTYKKSCSVLHPTSQNEFLFMLHVWVMILSATGVDEPLILMRFTLDIVYENLNVRNWQWQLVYFYFLIQLEQVEVEEDINLTNATSRGSMDTLRSYARDRAEAHYGRCIFRSKHSLEVEEGDVSGGEGVWNGKCSSSAKSICWVFNKAKSAKHGKKSLLPNGCCKHRHVCNAFVSDKGPGGHCEGNHPRYLCDNPSKISKPFGADEA